MFLKLADGDDRWVCTLGDHGAVTCMDVTEYDRWASMGKRSYSHSSLGPSDAGTHGSAKIRRDRYSEEAVSSPPASLTRSSSFGFGSSSIGRGGSAQRPSGEKENNDDTRTFPSQPPPPPPDPGASTSTLRTSIGSPGTPGSLMRKQPHLRRIHHDGTRFRRGGFGCGFGAGGAAVDRRERCHRVSQRPCGRHLSSSWSGSSGHHASK